MSYSRLETGTGTFTDAMKNGFGVVTVMNAYVYDYSTVGTNWASSTAASIAAQLSSATASAICYLDTLKISNITMEGPTKTVTGGQDASPLIKFGKTARIEIQDALGKIEALDNLCGGVAEWDSSSKTTVQSISFGEDFNKSVALFGDTYFVDTKGNQIDAYIIVYNMLPDSLFNLTQDAEGDATVFDLNGDLKAQKITMATSGTDTTVHKAYYSIVPKITA